MANINEEELKKITGICRFQGGELRKSSDTGDDHSEKLCSPHEDKEPGTGKSRGVL